MIHDVVDIESWRSTFPLDRIRAEQRRLLNDSFDGFQSRSSFTCTLDQYVDFRLVDDHALIVGPYDLALIEQLRAEMRDAYDVGDPVLTDVFVWVLGEPARREATKIGGLPYLPYGYDWPCTQDGRPMAFIGQFCFSDSRDIAHGLPGDILLIFAEPIWEQLFDGMGDGMQFTWLQLGETDLIAAEDVPTTDWPIRPCYGSVHRTFDFPELGPNGGDFWDDHFEWSGLGLIKATKIGGVPWWEQYDPHLPGSFLCVQDSIWQFFNHPYPFINHPDPIPWQTGYREWNDALVWGDVGRLYLQFDGERVHWEMQCG